MANRNIYTVGGTVQAGEGIYISRKADNELLTLCRDGTFAYILTPRQMGKSSLMLRTAERLKIEGIVPITIDLQQLGTQLNAEQWYLGILTNIEDALMLETEVLQWWNDNQHLGMTHRLTQFFQNVLLKERKEQIIIFIDEIDTTLSLPFTDDFYIVIRYLYNARADVPEFKRLSFVLIGVATPGDLISDPQRTPFNIGRRVDLSDFTFEEAKPLTTGFDLLTDKAQQLLRWVMKWTGGHPYLTQRLCYAIAAEDDRDWTEQDIDIAVARTFFDVTSEEDHDLQFVRDMLTKRAPEGMERETLIIYREIFQNKKPVIDEEQSIVKNHLKLSGIVKRKNQYLQLRNSIYREVFNGEWIKEHLPVDWIRRIRRLLIVLIGSLLLTATLIALTIITFKSRQEAISQKNRAEEQKQTANSLRQIAEDSTKAAQDQRERVLYEKERADKNYLQALTQQRIAQSREREAIKEKSIFDSLRSDAEAAKEEFRQQYLQANYHLAKLFEEKASKALTDVSETKSNKEYQKAWLYSLAALNQELAQDRSLSIPMSHLFSPKIQTEAFAQLWSSSYLFPVPYSVVFSPDGKRLASGSDDGSIRLWDLNYLIITDYKNAKCEAETFKKLYEASYFLLPFRLEELNLQEDRDFAFKLKDIPPPKPNRYVKFFRPRPVDKSPIEWPLECMK